MAAATAVSVNQATTPVAIASETFVVTMGTDTTITLTPTVIKAITSVQVTPLNSTAGTWAATYLNGFLPGAATVAFVGQNSAIWQVTLNGTIA